MMGKMGGEALLLIGKERINLEMGEGCSSVFLNLSRSHTNSLPPGI